jgi:diaminopimelate decarboxylase
VRSDHTSAQVRPPAFTYRAHPSGLRRLRDLELHCDAIPITTLVKRFGTPLYVYSASAIRQRVQEFESAFRHIEHTLCYSVKANSNLTILRLLKKSGCGFDVVSGGELQRVLKLDRRANLQVVFSGVGKTSDEIDLALRSKILLFNVESASELRRLSERCNRLKQNARIALRVNPDVDAETHPYISTGLDEHKFGIPIEEARELYARAAKERFLDVAGISVHIGSQITSAEPFGAAMLRVAHLIRELRADGHRIKYVDAGGGLGIKYDHANGEEEFGGCVSRYAAAVSAPLRDLDVHLLLEPGRAIVGAAGALITSVQYVKENRKKSFLVVDAAMNDLIRPSLYGAFHDIVPVQQKAKLATKGFDVVGPICETGDFFARDRQLPDIPEGELLAVLDTGAYGMVLASNYNTRPRAAEVLVDGRSAKLIRRRESFRDMVRPEL